MYIRKLRDIIGFKDVHLLWRFEEDYEYYAHCDSAHNGNAFCLPAIEYWQRSICCYTSQQLDKQFDRSSIDPDSFRYIYVGDLHQIRTRPKWKPQKRRYGDALTPIFLMFYKAQGACGQEPRRHSVLLGIKADL